MSSNLNPARHRFARLLERDDAEIDLALGALLIAAEEYPSLDVRLYLRRLDLLAGRVREKALSARSIDAVIAAMNAVLFEEEGFRGADEAVYYDPRSSFLNDVLDTRVGIPIALSVVYMEVGRRLGLTIDGIGLPGHFIVGVQASERVLIDPFAHGARLTVAECAARVRSVSGGRLSLRPEMLEPYSNRQILARVLGNLRSIYIRREDYPRAVAAIDRLLLIDPTAAHEYRDRGAIYQQFRFLGHALADFTIYLTRSPSAPDASTVRAALRALRGLVVPRN